MSAKRLADYSGRALRIWSFYAIKPDPVWDYIFWFGKLVFYKHYVNCPFTFDAFEEGALLSDENMDTQNDIDLEKNLR